jgi:hypothetical protein
MGQWLGSPGTRLQTEAQNTSGEILNKKILPASKTRYSGFFIPFTPLPRKFVVV